MQRRKKSFSEAKVVGDLAQWLTTTGYRVRTEVSLLGKSVDVVGIRGRWVTLFEAKVSDWRRAIQQCEGHDTVADYICIVIASARVADHFKHEASRRGYGIIHYSRRTGALSWICKPIRNTRVWRPQRKLWSLSSGKITYGH
jgi:Holliday junction resolvase